MDLTRYADLFLTESREHLSAINHTLLALERSPGDAEHVGALFRAVHTVKGMSATMGYTAVADLSHELETLLDRVRKGTQDVTPAVMDLLFASADALESAIELAVAGGGDEVAVAALVERLRALGSGPAAAGHVAAGGSRWTASAPDAPGRLVRVRIVPGTPLKGVRAFIAVQRARTVGDVTATSPALEALQAEAFGDDFALRLTSPRSAQEIAAAIHAAGDVAEVVVEDVVHEVQPLPPQLEMGVIEPGDFGGRTLAGAGGAGGAGAPPRDQDGGALAGEHHPEGAARTGSVRVAESALRQQRSVRIDLRRLDALMNLIGELVITRGRLTQLASQLGEPALDEAVVQASRLISDLQDEIMTSRMVPVWQVFDRFPRLVRDAARALDKQVNFVVTGKEIELDRSMLDEIGDPIVHLLRNAIDHGLETPEQRVAAGKPRVGQLTLGAVRDRSAVLIRVSDDGRGVDRARVLRRAQQLGLVEPAKTELSDDELLRLISRPGFSTAEKVTDISGRGVGIDAVQNRVRALGGSVEIRSTPGQGTTVTVRLPLTLAIVRALLARVDGETYALPMTHVSETVELGPNTLSTVKGREVLVLRDDVLPLVRLRDVVRLPRTDDRGRQVVVLEMAERRAGLVVDELTGQQEIVVKQFDAVRDGLSVFSGATILGDGAPALIVDVGSLL